ncbi:MAG: DUF2500 domain-containing protein [Propionibacteriaceae bacterium]|nr:DUF2500 domain-containing protein [Propionibacteriaceae bacterium]
MEFAFVLGVFAFIAIIIILAVVLAVTMNPAAIQARRDRSAPLLTAPARVVDKRMAVTGNSSSHGTNYFVTFQFSDGSRLELGVNGPASGQLSVNDEGVLVWQGSALRDFRREILR